MSDCHRGDGTNDNFAKPKELFTALEHYYKNDYII